jgi:hypothetical protein
LAVNVPITTASSAQFLIVVAFRGANQQRRDFDELAGLFIGGWGEGLQREGDPRNPLIANRRQAARDRRKSGAQPWRRNVHPVAERMWERLLRADDESRSVLR